MANSTGIVVAAGALAMTDLALDVWDPNRALRIAGGTVLSALIAAGLDRVVPGFGTGCAVILLATAVLTSGPRISEKLFPGNQGFGPA